MGLFPESMKNQNIMKKQSMLEAQRKYKFNWHTSIVSISEDVWNMCFKDNPTYNSYAYQKALENSAITGIVFHYITVSKNNTILSIATCFEHQVSLDIFATKTLSSCINFIRKFYKNFLTLRCFFAGHLTAVTDHTFGFNPSCDKTERYLLLREICNQIIAKSKQLHSQGTFIKEIPEQDFVFFKKTLAQKFIFVDSLPNTILSLNHSLPYSKQIRAKYRKLRKKRLRQFVDAGLVWEIQDNCENLSSIIEKMYLETFSRAEHKFEFLNRDYFNNVSKQLSNTFFILAKKQNEIVGFGFGLVETNSLKALYLGYDKQYGNIIYFNMFYRLIDEAFSRKKKYLLLGQTAYEFKQSLGAIFHRVYLGFHSHNKIVLLIVKKMNKYIFPEVKPMTKHIWKNTGG